ncbi:hypothetical protein [Ornithinimicrobium ciconiae]|uniref:hypothetical protein n=1 Tax=Ornithinimicrobium ciconiae TaxID=2594265 RepID=UPI001D185192|nr:hypothetical protein [Ornithinimicrobium ciconiae]
MADLGGARQPTDAELVDATFPKSTVPTNELQKSFFRAGHAHAGVLVILGLVASLYVDLTGLILLAAILMPAGFFLSVIGRDPRRPNGFSVLIWCGAAALTVGVTGAGIGLLTV